MMVAFDHRASLRSTLARCAGIASGSVDLAAHKAPIWEATRRVAAESTATSDLAMLVDRQTARRFGQRRSDLRMAVAIERSGERMLTLEAETPVLVRQLLELEPTWTKILVRWHPGVAASANAAQGQEIERAAAIAEAVGSELLIELLVPLDDVDLAMVGGHRDDYDRLVHPARLAEAMLQIRDHAEPALWKIDEVPSWRWCSALSRLVRDQRRLAEIVTLGGGRPIEDLRRGFLAARSGERFSGFAVGRSLWKQDIERYASKEIDSETATASIAHNLRALIEVYQSAVARDDPPPSSGAAAELSPSAVAERPIHDDV